MSSWEEGDPDEVLSIGGGYPEADRPIAAWCDPEQLHVRLGDGRQIATPLWWYPTLLAATPAERNNVELMLGGIHWPDVDEDLSIDGMLHGRKAKGAVDPGTLRTELGYREHDPSGTDDMSFEETRERRSKKAAA